MEWTWVPDKDGTPDRPITKLQSKTLAASDGASSIAQDVPAAGSGSVGGDVVPAANGGEKQKGRDGSSLPKNSDVYTTMELLRWKPGQLKTLLTDLGLDSSGCVEKRDIVEKIGRHPGGPAAAAAAAAARGEVRLIQAQPGSSEGIDCGDRGGDRRGDGAWVGSSVGRPGRDCGLSEDLKNMGIRALQAIMKAEGIDAAGCQSNEDFVSKIEEHRQKSFVTAAADAADAADPQTESEPSPDTLSKAEQEENEERNLVGMTLADYMNRPAPVAAAEAGHGRDRARGRGSATGGGRGKSGSGSACGARRGTANPRVVRLAPSHIAPPSTPAPDWVVEMQVCRGDSFYDSGSFLHSDKLPYNRRFWFFGLVYV